MVDLLEFVSEFSIKVVPVSDPVSLIIFFVLVLLLSFFIKNFFSIIPGKVLKFLSIFLFIWIVIYFPYLSINSSFVPLNINFPPFKIPIVSDNLQASSILCVINKIILWFLFCFKISQISFFPGISIPPVGSSKIIISFFPQKAIAIINFLFWPPDNFDTFKFLHSFNL